LHPLAVSQHNGIFWTLEGFLEHGDRFVCCVLDQRTRPWDIDIEFELLSNKMNTHASIPNRFYLSILLLLLPAIFTRASQQFA
jgi:hypothetical protein